MIIDDKINKEKLTLLPTRVNLHTPTKHTHKKVKKKEKKKEKKRLYTHRSNMTHNSILEKGQKKR